MGSIDELTRSVTEHAASAAAMLVDEDGRCLEATSEAAAMLGMRREDLTGKTLASLCADGWEWAVRNAMLRLRSGSTEAFALLLRGRSGRRTLIEMLPQTLARDDRTVYLLAWQEQPRRALAVARTESEEELRRLAERLLAANEVERSTLAAKLHDELASVLIMAKFNVEDAIGRLARGAGAEAIDTLRIAATQLRGALAEIRRISTDLRPNSLDDLGLLPTLRWYCRNLAEAYAPLQVRCVLEAEETQVPEALKLHVFRIAQEALNNVIAHAKASEAVLTLTAKQGALDLRVEDNGIGFDIGPFTRGEACPVGLGLQRVRKRIEATRGTMLLDSAPWQGTVVGARWPLAAPRQ